MIETVYIIRKDEKGGVLTYSKANFESNINVLAEYRLATKEEISRYYDIEEVEPKEAKNKEIETETDEKFTVDSNFSTKKTKKDGV